MKVSLTGSTGFIGREVLEQCLQNARITSIIALSRRELSPSVTHNPKLKVLIMENFLSYSPSILREIRDAEACIWYFAYRSTEG
jgi:nucleoside-diphosphate-sugar epimerase